MCGFLKKVLARLLRRMPSVVIKTIGFDHDYLHMFIVIPPKYSIASVMGRLKSQSASQLRKQFGWSAKAYWKKILFGRQDYFVSSVGLDERTVKRYVEHQGRQDSGQLRMEL